MIRISLMSLLGCLLLAAGIAVAAPMPGAITGVTVYRGQALVTRELDFDAVAGPQELVVSQLPEYVLPESLYATAGIDVTVRSVRFRSSAVTEEPRDEVRALDAQIAEKQLALKGITTALGVLDSRSKYLDKLEGMTSTLASADLSKGALDPKALIETTTFIFNQREEIANKRLAQENEKAKIEDNINALQRDRSKLTAGSNKTLREAVVLLDAKKVGRAHLALHYLVNGVNWAPSYSARLSDKRDKMTLEYHAVVTQTSGEDWPAVDLTLSTTRPNMKADSPLLAPLWISLVSAGEADANMPVSDVGAFRAQRDQINAKIRLNANTQPGPQGPQGMAGPAGQPSINPPANGFLFDESTIEQNKLAGSLQQLELNVNDDTLRSMRTMKEVESEGLAVAYALPGKVSLQSRSDQQMFRIAALELPATFYYTAVPLLSDYVYQAVDAVNNSEYPLLPGPYNAYIDGSFAGQGWLPLMARGQNFTVGFGTETQLRVARELAGKTTELHGGNQRMNYQYALRIQNFMTKAVKVRVWDRLPQAPANNVTVTPSKMEPALSTDEFYTMHERPRGLLRWDVDVPASASGAKAVQVKYDFQMEFDKSYRVGELASNVEEKMRQDFEDRFNMRNSY